MMLVALSRNVPALLDDAARNRKNLIRDRAAHGLAPATVLRGEDTTKVSKWSGSAEVSEKPWFSWHALRPDGHGSAGLMDKEIFGRENGTGGLFVFTRTGQSTHFRSPLYAIRNFLTSKRNRK